ncbi:unnamed protein product [Tilletia caries]|nr:unnamed protein product [Tilletia caries]CAD6955678.1 unnamed protein product [Tilletia controversa]
MGFHDSMSWTGAGTIELVKGRMDSKQYIEILDRKLLPMLDAVSITPGAPQRHEIIFQQDNDPKHTSKLTKAWFKKNKIEPLTWPANSPDINPIEHMWGALKRRLAAYDTDPRGANELWDRVQKEWANLTVAEAQKLIESMPRRCAAVVAAKGGNTKY